MLDGTPPPAHSPIPPMLDLDELLCPRCGGNNLHHRRVIVRNRGCEDAEGVRVTVDRASAVLEPETKFSGRRDDLGIEFECESCHMAEDSPLGGRDGKPFVLRIMQHKGTTYVSWEPLQPQP